MKLTVLGCAGSFPGPDSPCSAYLLQADGFSLVIDLGNGSLSALQRHHDLYDVDAVLISHLHPDHWIDLCSYLVVRKYGSRAAGLPRVPVYGPEGTRQRLASASAERDGGTGVFDHRALSAGTTRIGPFEVTVRRMNHPVETYGVRIEHGGGALAYSADTGACDELVELATDADVLLCEASFLDEAGNVPNLHLSGREAGEHATAAGARRLLLTHLVAWHDQERVLAEARAAYDGPLEAVKPGAIYDI